MSGHTLHHHHPIAENTSDDALRRATIQLGILVTIVFYLYRKTCQMIRNHQEKMNRKEIVPGFPSRPNPHWLVGHLMVLRGIEEESADARVKGAKSNRELEELEAQQGCVGKFVRGYHRVYCEFADPETGFGSFWFFHIPTVSVLRGRDAKKIMRSSSFRKSLWIINTHTRQFLGKKTILALMKKEWRYYRNAMHKSFTSETVKESRPFIYQVGNTLANSLLEKIAQNQDSVDRKSFHTVETVATEEDESISDHESEDGTSLPSANVGPLPPPQSALRDDTSVPVSVLPLMKMATIDIFGLVALRSNEVDFGCTRDLKLSPIAFAFDHLTGEYNARLKRPWDPFSFFYSIPTRANREHRKNRMKIRGFIDEQVAQTRARIAARKRLPPDQRDNLQHDLLTNLITAADSEKTKAQKKGQSFDDKEHDEALGDVLMTLLFAGYDTTSISLTYALYLLAKNPAKKAKCLAEIDAVLGNRDGAHSVSPGPEELPYTKAVVLETLRLYPAAPTTSRTIEKPTTIGGDIGGGKKKTATLEEGQVVMIPIYCIQRSELNYPRPNEMIPERWVRRKRKRRNLPDRNEKETHNTITETSLWEVRPEDDSRKEEDSGDSADFESIEEEEEEDASIAPANREAFCAFAAGARNCVGKNLAIEESVILLACLLRKLSFDLVSEAYQVAPCIHSVVQQPDDDLPMVVRPRR